MACIIHVSQTYLQDKRIQAENNMGPAGQQDCLLLFIHGIALADMQ